ncbi:MAG TPA: GNAT family N-acetyltransferase [Bryobacteraceae bacterium]|nr:GNAT family N-acetyltransferase [Bryobacteraceae bacterium]
MGKSEILVKNLVWGTAVLFGGRFRLASKWSKIKDNKMSARIYIRPFRADDMERIMEIERASFGRGAYDRKLFAELSHTCGDLFLVAAAGGNICGYMITCMRGQKAGSGAELVSVAVDPASRGRGTASSLIKNTLRRLRLRKAVRFSLMVRATNEAARRLYERHGFRRVRKVARYYEDGEDGVLMSKPL